MWRWWRKTELPPFRGLRPGMTVEQAIRALEDQGHTRGVKVTGRETSDPEGGSGTVYADDDVWTVYADTNDVEILTGRMGQWRKPSGLDDGIAWMQERIGAYGLPDQHAILPSSATRPHHSTLEWNRERIRTTISMLKDEEWNVREDWERHPFQRENGATFDQHRRLVDELHARTTQAAPEVYREYLDGTRAWLSAQREALARLEPLVRKVQVFDVWHACRRARSLLDIVEQHRNGPWYDGAFVVAAWNDTADIEKGLNDLRYSSGIEMRQLSARVDYRVESGAPRPTSPAESVEWMSGPFAPGLLEQTFAGRSCKIYPATFTTVDDAREEHVGLPPPDPESSKARLTHSLLRPFRLVHPGGLAVDLNLNGTEDELRRFAHALLAAKLAAR